MPSGPQNSMSKVLWWGSISQPWRSGSQVSIA